jgi:hypothetical protein
MKLLLALVALAALPSLAADRTLTGTWNMSLNVSGQDYALSCTFKQNGEKLTGTCGGESGTGELTGLLTDGKISWTHTIPFNGDTLTLSYSGAFTADAAIKGTVHVAPFDIDGDFTGQKAPAEK